MYGLYLIANNYSESLLTGIKETSELRTEKFQSHQVHLNALSLFKKENFCTAVLQAKKFGPEVFVI